MIRDTSACNWQWRPAAALGGRENLPSEGLNLGRLRTLQRRMGEQT
jgi:hypothetical protein